MKPSTMAHDPAATDASPRLGWRVALNRFTWRAHIFTASSLVVWLERWFPNRGSGERLFAASARLTNWLVGVRVDVIGLDRLDPRQTYVSRADGGASQGALRGQTGTVR